MSSIIEKYSQIYKKMKAISDEMQCLQEEISLSQDQAEESIPARIAHLEEQIKKIDDYILKVQAFRHLAEKQITSKNLLTIEAPENYRVNLNRLRKWAMLIDPKEKKDPSEGDDPYAQKVYLVASCDELFLNRKREEFTKKIDKLKEQETSDLAVSIYQKNARIAQLKEEQKALISSAEFIDFLKCVEVENMKFWNEKTPELYLNTTSDEQIFAPGAYSAAFPIEKEYQDLVKGHLGKFYDETASRILLPVEISLEKEFVMTVSCAPSKDKSLDKGIQNAVLNIINNSTAGKQKIYVIDGVRFNTSSMGTLKQLEKTFALERIPRNQDQITEALEKIVSSFADIDEKLGDFDSVKSYNSAVEEAQKIALTTIVLYGWPNAYLGRNHELLKRIMTNYERYGVSFITVEYKKKEDLNVEVNSGLPEYATHNAIHVRMFPNDCTIELPDKKAQRFVWYSFNDSLSEAYVESLEEYKIEEKVIGSEYINRYSLENLPPYVRGEKEITLPFGVDAKDQAHSISFNNENFASYLMGASGSGKSTLLHTLITGIIRNYHPDDVELWLADFKMSEFAQYMDPMPPHIKYILLDESPELVYDLVDKLTEKMMERQKFFMRHKDLKKVENVKDTYMPVILVMLDEFSIMSQAIGESETYKLKLQNLLAKGRALGIKFVFASQDFSKGIRGLTATAKDQIQSRIAMKNNFAEIDQTLELSSSMKTEQVRNWMEAIPPYYALLKYRDKESVRVKRVNVMYFKGSGDKAYEPQRNMIKRINDTMKVVEDYTPEAVNSYVNKYPVVVDGNSFDAFRKEKILQEIDRIKRDQDCSGDELFVFAGTPRLMTQYKEFVVTPESRQNFLVLCDSSEASCGTAVMNSVMESFKMQNNDVKIWAYERNKIYRSARKDLWSEESIVTGLENLCQEIKQIKEEIQSGEDLENRLIVLLGFENICADFELLDATQNKKAKSNSGENQAAKTVVVDKELIKNSVEQIGNISVDMSKASAEEVSMQEQFKLAMSAFGSSDDDDEEDDDEDVEFLDANAINAMTSNFDLGSLSFGQKKETSTVEEEKKEAPIVVEESKEEPEEAEVVVKLYNAKEDLKYIVQHGSRKGIHFLLYLNTYSDLKQTGLKEDFFKHRLAFRIPADDSKIVFGNSAAANLPDHICLYSDRLDRFSFRPYLHKGISWDGWGVDENGEVINPMI